MVKFKFFEFDNGFELVSQPLCVFQIHSFVVDSRVHSDRDVGNGGEVNLRGLQLPILLKIGLRIIVIKLSKFFGIKYLGEMLEGTSAAPMRKVTLKYL